LGQVIFDILRSTVPISFLVKGSGSVTSVLMNQYIYRGAQASGHVLAATGYGYIFGGSFLFFWPALLNILCVFVAEKWVKKCRSYEGIRIWLYVLLRFGLNCTANTPALLSAATIHLFTAGLVTIGASILKREIRRK